ncbi:hypothetical protein [Streptomyces sp. NBC_00083]|uniref:hypothetical protein n=1 Tax=Streptomyces sp. NBC_00083 TaxID=2975647 RepID=UPI0022550769|nr:hypothetical protein [Streptomyces sp. NBC_00083]MCX5384050.1 hypothetical protein [Streptomyces sp. NBC_00083]
MWGGGVSAQLRDTAGELAGLLWREHTLYRERSGGVVIRGAHVERWISLSPTGGKDQVLIRAGRILHGGTTAPARSEAVASLTLGTGELALICRRLLADTAAGTAPRADGVRGARPARRPGKAARTGRHTGIASWIVILAVASLVALFLRDLVASQ